MSKWKPGDQVLIPVTDEMLDLSGEEAYTVPCVIRDDANCSPDSFNLDDGRGVDHARWDNVPASCFQDQA
jgi:hypothetical protein